MTYLVPVITGRIVIAIVTETGGKRNLPMIRSLSGAADLMECGLPGAIRPCLIILA